jgi:hypothetical protein
MERRHELPTHLGVEDHILGNLSMRQLLLLLSGLAAAYAAWTQLPALPVAVRATLAATVLLLTPALALVRPGDRSLAAWALAVLRYHTLARVAVWQPRLPDRLAGRQDGTDWSAHAPHLTWAGNPAPTAPGRNARTAVPQ